MEVLLEERIHQIPCPAFSSTIRSHLQAAQTHSISKERSANGHCPQATMPNRYQIGLDCLADYPTVPHLQAPSVRLVLQTGLTRMVA